MIIIISSARKRAPIQVSEEQKEYRALLHKDWARYQRQEKLELHKLCRNILQSQNKALAELRLESEELYQAAIQPDETMLPITVKGPVNTPPIKNYESPAEYCSSRHLLFFIFCKTFLKTFLLVFVFIDFVFFFSFTGRRLQRR